MPAVTFTTDTVFSVIRSNDLLLLVGFDSVFASEPHPGTGNTIKGWIWDERVWASDIEENTQDFAPSIWDPVTEGLSTNDFQSGIGDNRDLKVSNIIKIFPGGTTGWFPEINNGFYYDHDVEGFLFSDDSVTQIFPSGTLSGINFTDLQETPFTGEPITATKWQWNATKGRYDYAIRFNHRAEFTGTKDPEGIRADTITSAGDIIFTDIDTTFEEFVVDSRTEPFTAYLNDDYTQEHGLPFASGVTTMEFLGTALGTNNEEIHLEFSPVVSGVVEVVSYFNESGPFTTWTEVNEITVAGEFKLDFDKGLIVFGSGVNFHPAPGEQISAHYFSTVALEYEPEWSRRALEARETEINPIEKTSDDGFIFLQREELDPFSILLEAELPLISSSVPNFGPVFLGGSFANLIGTVKTRNGQVLQGEKVTFQVIDGGGSFSGGQSTVVAITGGDGKARTPYNTPRSINETGNTSTNVVTDLGLNTTTITIANPNLTGDATDFTIYKVFADDPILGVDSLETYYDDFFTDEEITGPTAETIDGTGQDWEDVHRQLLELQRPTLYSEALQNGRKELLFHFDSAAIHPHDFTSGAFVPLRPLSSITDTDGNLVLTMSGILDVPRSAGNADLAGYFIAGPAKTRFQASVVNEKTGATIVSNEIDLEIRILPAQDGTVLIENLNDVEKSEIFGVVSPPDSGELPLGWRIRSANVGVSSAVDGLTYININSPTNVLGHAITVTVSGEC